MRLNIPPCRWFKPHVNAPGQLWSDIGKRWHRLARLEEVSRAKADIYFPAQSVQSPKTTTGLESTARPVSNPAALELRPQLLLPPAAEWPLRNVPNPIVSRGWERHAAALRRLKPVQKVISKPYKQAIRRHNDAVINARQQFDTAANGEVGRALARDLHRGAVAVHRPVELADRLVSGPLNRAAQIATGNSISKVVTGFAVGLVVSHNPAASTAAVVGSGLGVAGLKVLKKAYQAVYDDGNSVRRWIKDFGNRLPTF